MSSTIISAEVILTSPSRNFVTLKVTTDDGVVGWGTPPSMGVSWP